MPNFANFPQTPDTLIQTEDLRTQVQLTYWSDYHIGTKSLLEQLPFGEILGPIRFYTYVDFQLRQLADKAKETLQFWVDIDARNYNGEPINQISLFYDETFLWHYCAPSYFEEIKSLLRNGNRIRFLSRFSLTQTQIEVEFNEIRLQQGGPEEPQLVYTDSKEYTYQFADAIWEVRIQNHEFDLINPSQFTLPIGLPNTQGRDTEYQERLELIRAGQQTITTQSRYWGSIQSSSGNTTPLDEFYRARDRPTISDSDPWPPIDWQIANPVFSSPNICGCGIDICYCDTPAPDTPPTPNDICLWKPALNSRPLDRVHYNRQTG